MGFYLGLKESWGLGGRGVFRYVLGFVGSEVLVFFLDVGWGMF